MIKSDIKYQHFQTFFCLMKFHKFGWCETGGKAGESDHRTVTFTTEKTQAFAQWWRAFLGPWGLWREGSRWVVGYTATLNLTYCFFGGGSEIRKDSPVEVGSWNPICLQGFFTCFGGAGFLPSTVAPENTGVGRWVSFLERPLAKCYAKCNS